MHIKGIIEFIISGYKMASLPENQKHDLSGHNGADAPINTKKKIWKIESRRSITSAVYPRIIKKS